MNTGDRDRVKQPRMGEYYARIWRWMDGDDSSRGLNVLKLLPRLQPI